MTTNELINFRLQNLQLSQTKFTTPAELAAYLCCIQAQDYHHSKWTVGIRLSHITDTIIEQAFANNTIVRTWAMRGTLQIAALEDIGWLTELFGAKIISSCASRYRNLELDASTLNKCNDILVKSLRNQKHLTRDELTSILAKHNITANGIRLAHILQYATYHKLICHGVRKGGDNTYRLLDISTQTSKHNSREESLAEIAKRYFISRGPATLQDFFWWTGLSMGDAKKGLEAVQSLLQKETINEEEYWFSKKNTTPTSLGKFYLLPGFDEYILAYKDRSLCLDKEHSKRVIQSNGIFNPTIVVNGKVVGTWKRTLKKENVIIQQDLFSPLTAVKTKMINEAAQYYGQFLTKRVEII